MWNRTKHYNFKGPCQETLIMYIMCTLLFYSKKIAFINLQLNDYGEMKLVFITGEDLSETRVNSLLNWMDITKYVAINY